MQHSTVGCVLRSDQAFYQQITDRCTLEHGICVYSTRYPTLPQANQFREVVIARCEDIPTAFEAAESFFVQKDLTCYRWAPAQGCGTGFQPMADLDALTTFLASKGYKKHVYNAMILTRWLAIKKINKVRLLPARAMRAAFRRTFEQEVSNPEKAQVYADAYQERLDDPQLDMFVAMIGDMPVGRGALYQVGDIARIKDVYVCPVPHLDTNIELADIRCAILAHLLTLAQRLEMRNICVRVLRSDESLHQLYESAGFIVDGEIVEYDRTV